MSEEKVHEILHQKADKEDIRGLSDQITKEVDRLFISFSTLTQQVSKNESQITDLDKRVSFLERDKIERDESRDRRFTWVHGVLIACIGLAPFVWELFSKFL